LVQRFVGVSHGDLGAVRELLAAHPSLANACWDWGEGDFETALGAASHTGQREIAELLLNSGARMDIFAAAMLGLTEVVRAIVAARPEALKSKGPHGIPLAVHAQAGGARASDVLSYLHSHEGR
jgi:hypothetical protein